MLIVKGRPPISIGGRTFMTAAAAGAMIGAQSKPAGALPQTPPPFEMKKAALNFNDNYSSNTSASSSMARGRSAASKPA